MGWRVGTVGDIVEIHDSKRIPLSVAQRAKMEKRIILITAQHPLWIM